MASSCCFLNAETLAYALLATFEEDASLAKVHVGGGGTQQVWNGFEYSDRTAGMVSRLK